MEQNLLKDDNIPKSYWKLAIPVVLSMIVGLVYNLADTYFIAATNDTTLVAGVSLCAPILTIQMAFGNVFAQGGCTLTSRLLGAKKTDDIRKVSSYCIYAGYLLGLVLGIFFFFSGNVLLPILGADAETEVFAFPYYKCLVLGSPFIVASYVYTNLFRSEGLSREAMLGTSIGLIINIILDPVFIFQLGMGAKGAAIATVMGYFITDIYCTVIVLKKSSILAMNLKLIRIPADYVSQILGIGIPAAIMNIVQSLSVIFMNRFLLPYGNQKIAAMGIALKTVSIVNLILVGLAYGGQPLFGYFFGAKDTKRLKELAKFNIMVSVGIAFVLSAIVFVTAPFLIRCFMDNSQIIEDGSLMLRLQIITMIFAGVVLLFTLIFQSAGRIGISFVLSVSRQGFIFLTVLFVLSHLFGYYGVLAAQAAADGISILFSGMLFYHFLYKNWK